MPDDGTAHDDRRVVLRGLGLSSLGYPLITGLQFVSTVLAARLLTADDFGTFSLAVSIVTVAALIAQLGLPNSLLRRASSALMRGDNSEARHEIYSAFGVGSLAALTCGVLLGSPLGSELLETLFSETGVGAIAVLIGIRAALRVLEQIVPEALRAFRDYVRVVVFDGLLTNALLVSAFLVLIITSSKVSIDTIMTVAIAVSAVALVPAVVTVVRKIPRTGDRLKLRNPVEPAMWASTIGRVIIAQLDLLVIGALGTSKEVALYAKPPFRLVLLVGLPLIVVNQIVSPLFAGWYARGMQRRLERTARGTAGIAVIAAAALAVVFLVGGRAILGLLFGPVYEDAYTVLVILSVGQVLQTWAGSCGMALMMTGHHRQYATLLGVSTVLTLALDIVLYEAMGIEGVAVATATMLVTQNFAQVWMLRRYAGFSTAADLRSVAREARALRDQR